MRQLYVMTSMPCFFLIAATTSERDLFSTRYSCLISGFSNSQSRTDWRSILLKCSLRCDRFCWTCCGTRRSREVKEDNNDEDAQVNWKAGGDGGNSRLSLQSLVEHDWAFAGPICRSGRTGRVQNLNA